MELMLTYPRKYSGIILSALDALGYHCQEPIPLVMNDASPNGRLAVSGHRDYDADTTQILINFEVLCSEPWFDTKTMFLHLEGIDSTCSTIPALCHA